MSLSEPEVSRVSHTRTVSVVRTTINVNGKGQNLTPATAEPLNRSSPKFTYVIMSWISTILHNFIQIG